MNDKQLRAYFAAIGKQDSDAVTVGDFCALVAMAQTPPASGTVPAETTPQLVR